MSISDREWADGEVDRSSITALFTAADRHPACEDCKRGKGTILPGPPHCAEHDRHCTAEGCGW